jgi:hypothetical protein
MKSSVAHLIMALGLVVIGLAFAAAGIYIGDTDDAPGAALLGILLMIGTVALAVRTARRKTPAGSLRESRASTAVPQKNIVRIAIITACALAVPLVAMQVSEEWNWDLFDFAFAGTLMFGTGMAYELLARRAARSAYRAGVGVALAAAFMLIWANAAVGLIGDGEQGLISLICVGVVLAVGFVGGLLARFQPHGMARALLATALAQAMVAVLAVTAGWGSAAPIWPRDIVMATGLFGTLWIVSALLFRRAARARVEPAA